MRFSYLYCTTFLLVSCIQFVPPTPELEQNYPPHILDTGIDPPELEVIISQTQNPNGTKVFKVTRVQDLNRQDTLYAYWFLGYQQFPGGSFRCQDRTPPLTGSDIDNITRKVEFVCRISHNDLTLRQGEVVSLELFVVDREADLTSLISSNGVRRWPEGSGWHRWVWNIKTE